MIILMPHHSMMSMHASGMCAATVEPLSNAIDTASVVIRPDAKTLP